MFASFRRWWLRRFPSAATREIDEELRLHLALRAEEYQRSGAAPREAHRRALRRFGSPKAVADACRAVYGVRNRDEPPARGPLMGNLLQDVRYGVRSLRRQPVFTLFAVATIAVGIGANTVIYSAVNSTLLHPMPFDGGDRYLRIWHTSPAGAFRMSPHPTAVHAWRERVTSLDGIATYGSEQVVVRLSDEPQLATAAAASVQLLPFLGVEPILGRRFIAEDTVPGENRVVLLSERFWNQEYGGRRDILGQSLMLDNEPYTIIGVLPKRADAFFGRFDPESPLDYAFWLPGANKQANVARLRPGATIERVLEEVTTIHAQLEFESGDAAAWPPEIGRPRDSVASRLETTLWILLATVGFVLLLACVNVTNMLLIRGVSRNHELGVRTALGASRWRLMRQFLVESAILTTAAAAAAVALAVVAIQVLQPLIPPSLDALQQIRLDGRVLFVTLGLAATCAVVFGLVPVSQIRPADIGALLTQGPRAGLTTRSRTRLRSLLVAVEVALATVLFVGAGLMIKSLIRLNAHDPGLDPVNLISFAVSLPETRYPDADNRHAFFGNLVVQLRRTPGVHRAALGAVGVSGFLEGAVLVEGEPEPHPGRGISTNFVSEDYFRTVGVPIRGREYMQAEIAGVSRDVVIVNENFARTYWPAVESALGQRFRFAHSERWRTVIGVASNVELSGLHADPTQLMMYEPYSTWPIPSLRVAVRTDADPTTVVPAIKGTVWQLDLDLPLRNIQIATDIVRNTNAAPRFNALMLTLFAGLGLGLAVMGVYSVVALAVRHRTHELGIRVALGATAHDGVRLMLAQGLRPVAAGIILGLAGALALTRFLSALLFQVTPTDPATYGLVLFALLGTAGAACYLPARRATRIDPMAVLRIH